MTPAEELLYLLKREGAALKSRAFHELDEIARRKDECVVKLTDKIDPSTLERIVAQARDNERMLTVSAAAARGLKERFTNIGIEQTRVGYGADGREISCQDEKNTNRV